MAGNGQGRGLGNSLGSSYIFIKNKFSVYFHTCIRCILIIFTPQSLFLPLVTYLYWDSPPSTWNYYMRGDTSYFSESGTFCLTWWSPGTSISLSVAQFHSFTWLNYPPLCSTPRLLIHSSTDRHLSWSGILAVVSGAVAVICEWSCGNQIHRYLDCAVYTGIQ